MENKLIISNPEKYACITREGLKEFNNYEEFTIFCHNYENKLKQEHFELLDSLQETYWQRFWKTCKMLCNTLKHSLI